MRWFHRSMIVWQPAWTSSNPRVCKRTICGKKDIQHLRFPCSPLPKYWSGPSMLSFAVRMGYGAFMLVWSYDEGSARVRTPVCAKEPSLKKKKDIQHPRFPYSPLLKYWSGLTMLNFAVRMGCGGFIVVWSYDEDTGKMRYSCVKSEKKKKKRLVIFHKKIDLWFFGKKKLTRHFWHVNWLVRFFFSLTRPEHCWPFISSSYQASLPNVRCWLPKFDSKILITSNALQRDSRRRTPWTPAYGPFSLKKTRSRAFMVPFQDGVGATYRSRFQIKKKQEKAARAFSRRIVKRGLNLMRSMQQGISTHYNTRLGI